ncbi:hypothetical protein NMQ14_13035 [Methyloversatilis sp. XJ19-13]|uniref:hypothetical protein n=1 Tax=Methyloversatilis sp. XJ19-13 TaxID=2963430 RepID=UPI00211CC89A|nr:hypothetical protein [Methyloversatilis sp. XJ19-13]MCQ9375177.1 hypothetical protein [Methyloversatilis sp. XJ19-13]
MAPLAIALSLAELAPRLMRYFGAGEQSTVVAEKVIEVAKQVTGEPTGEAALAAIQGNPERAHQWRMAALAADTEIERTYLDDRRDARARDVALAQAGFRNRRADWMVAIDAVGLVACLAVLALFRKEIPAEVVTLLSTIASLFGVCLRDAHQFEFGSSRGSREKDVILGGAAKPPS